MAIVGQGTHWALAAGGFFEGNGRACYPVFFLFAWGIDLQVFIVGMSLLVPVFKPLPSYILGRLMRTNCSIYAEIQGSKILPVT